MEASLYTPVKSKATTTCRILTPSPERLRLHHVVYISPKKRVASSSSIDTPPTKRIFNGRGEVPELDTKFDLPDGKPTLRLNNAVAKSLRVVFEDFSLLENGLPRLPRSPEEEELLWNLFETTFAVAFGPIFIIIRVRKLPAKPWPASVAGLPLFLTTDDKDEPLNLGRPGAGGKHLTKYDASNGARSHDLTTIIDAVIEYFNRQQASVLSVVYLGNCWMIFMENLDISFAKLPTNMCNLSCFYRVDEALSHAKEAATRLIHPTDVIRDDSDYSKDLRPGVMLACGRTEPTHLEWFTTSGIAIRNKTTNASFITVSSHGFPYENNQVWHPTSKSKMIGIVEGTFRGKDIALVSLEPNLKYTNEPFAPKDQLRSTPITGILKATDLKLFDPCHMNSPFTGDMQGQLLGYEKRKVPCEDPTGPHSWVGSNWIWFGNGVGPTEGCCGTPVLRDDKVVCFFRYLCDDGIARAVSAEILSEEYEVCNIEG